MTNLNPDMRLINLLFDVMTCILACCRVHSVALYKQEFILWLGIALSFGWLAIGDIDYYIDIISLGDLNVIGNQAMRVLPFKTVMFATIAYMVVFGSYRNKPKSPDVTLDNLHGS